MDGRVNNGGYREGAGRKTTEEELALYKDKVKKNTIEELATSKVYNHLENIEATDRQGVKEIALPVYLKSKADKIEQDISGKIEIINYADTIQIPAEGLPIAPAKSD